jgi:sarcosine oxidase subunit beta
VEGLSIAGAGSARAAPAAGGQPHTEIAIVGAGITGLSIAWQLARRGAGPIKIYDGSGVGSGATGLQPGGVRQQWGTPLACAMAREAYSFYKDVDRLLEPAVAPNLDPCGYLFLAETQAELDVLRARVVVQRAAGVPSEILKPDRAGELVPGLAADAIIGAAYCAEDGYFDRPQAVVAATAASAWRMGVSLVGAHVVSIHHDGDGWRLELADGSTWLAGRVIVAAAQETATLLRPLGVELPIQREVRYLFYSDPVRERLLEPLVISNERHFAAKQLRDGSVLASDLNASGDPDADKTHWYSHIRRTITDLVPILEYVSFPVMVEGFYDVTPDAQPILGQVSGHEGLFVAAGMNGRGFMMAPTIGRFIAAAVCGDADGDPLVALSVDRFDGRTLIPERQIV